ncbi:MAG TPA: zf-HC2 domain-containing protein [Candidatus Eisenbacteria bacterium]|nr:zf-HC2 domain-containing protein [Candidatus Eisenbacteria bacterium]
MIHVTIQQLSSYLDEQLAEGSADLVRQHLAECPECETRLGTLSRMDAALTQALSHDPGEDLYRTLEREIAAALGADAASKAKEILEDASTKASAPPRVPTSTAGAARPNRPFATSASGAAVSKASGSTQNRQSVRDVPATAWTPSAGRGTAGRGTTERGTTGRGTAGRSTTERGTAGRRTAARVPDPPRSKGSSAGPWVAVLSLAVIAGSVGVVVSHSGAVQGWLDSLISNPNFTVPKPGDPAPGTATAPGVPDPTATDSAGATVDVMAIVEATPGTDATPEPATGTNTSTSASAPLPPPPPRAPRATSTADSDVEPFDDGGNEFSEEETMPQTPQSMRADEAMATFGSSAGSGRGPGGDRKTDPYAGLRPESQAAVREAERVHQQTLLHPTAEQFEGAAARWERALEGVSGPEQVTIRGRLADARYRAWEAGPTSERADAAISAIRSYLLFAPPGSAREEARARLARLDTR